MKLFGAMPGVGMTGRKARTNTGWRDTRRFKTRRVTPGRLRMQRQLFSRKDQGIEGIDYE